ncbi:MAG: copper chaperone PCu(A)C [Pseudomonadota bacterium]|nr:copper chaperone PCu(A)C [Pseudomonadota bacterium]
MRSAVPILAVLLPVAACDRAPPKPRVTVEDAVVVLPVLPGRPGAAYFVLRTNNDPTRLTGVTSPRVGRIELHETVSERSLARMRPLRDTTFAPDEPLSFAAGSRHAMLLDIDASVRAGGTVPLTFSFDSAPAVTAEAEVRSAEQGS